VEGYQVGYRFTLNEINTVALLIEGRVTRVIEEILYSPENYRNNCDGLTQIIRGFKERFYTSDEYENSLLDSLQNFNIGNFWYKRNGQSKISFNDIVRFPEVHELHEILVGLHRLFGNSKVNAIPDKTLY
jgi:hypothetical protein